MRMKYQLLLSFYFLLFYFILFYFILINKFVFCIVWNDGSQISNLQDLGHLFSVNCLGFTLAVHSPNIIKKEIND